MKNWLMVGLVLAAGVVSAATVVDVTGTGVQKTPVEIKVANTAFANSLKRNLELSGLFEVRSPGAITVSGVSGALKAEGRGKTISAISQLTDDKAARMAARRMSDMMCEAYGNQKGFAQDRVLFLNRGTPKTKGAPIPAELCMSYPDGNDIRQITNDGKMIIFQRWMGNTDNVLYISDKNGPTQIWQLNVATGQRSVKWSFKGTPTGIAVSPDGHRVAAILSIHGNPELYVLDVGKNTWQRLTNTQFEVEGQPAWSPDGTKIAFVRGVNAQQIWMIDLATRQERRLTTKGRKNVDPDWGANGQLAYVSGAYVNVMDVAKGESSARAVTDAAKWEHPSWSRDGRHLTASRDRAVFVIDTKKDGADKPKQMFYANGNWTAPCWSK